MLFKKLNWVKGDQYDELITADDVSNWRPAPDMINKAVEIFQVKNCQVIKIGDTTIDIQEGQNGKCGLSVGVTTGAQTREQL